MLAARVRLLGEELRREKEALGMYVSSHPLAPLRDQLEHAFVFGFPFTPGVPSACGFRKA